MIQHLCSPLYLGIHLFYTFSQFNVFCSLLPHFALLNLYFVSPLFYTFLIPYYCCLQPRTTTWISSILPFIPLPPFLSSFYFPSLFILRGVPDPIHSSLFKTVTPLSAITLHASFSPTSHPHVFRPPSHPNPFFLFHLPPPSFVSF